MSAPPPKPEPEPQIPPEPQPPPFLESPRSPNRAIPSLSICLPAHA